MPSQAVSAVAIDPVTPQNVYLARPQGLFRSADGGLTWSAMGESLGAEPVALTLDPQHPATLIALVADGTMLRSEDGGTTWAALEVDS